MLDLKFCTELYTANSYLYKLHKSIHTFTKLSSFSMNSIRCVKFTFRNFNLHYVLKKLSFMKYEYNSSSSYGLDKQSDTKICYNFPNNSPKLYSEIYCVFYIELLCFSCHTTLFDLVTFSTFSILKYDI